MRGQAAERLFRAGAEGAEAGKLFTRDGGVVRGVKVRIDALRTHARGQALSAQGGKGSFFKAEAIHARVHLQVHADSQPPPRQSAGNERDILPVSDGYGQPVQGGAHRFFYG